jgi:hypothetical protein
LIAATTRTLAAAPVHHVDREEGEEGKEGEEGEEGGTPATISCAAANLVLQAHTPDRWANPDKEGSLTKRGTFCLLASEFLCVSYGPFSGDVIQNWKLRYFRLKAPYLYYFEDIKSTKPKGIINLHGATVELAKHRAAKSEHKFCFEVHVPSEKRTYLVNANGEEDLAGWVSSIQLGMRDHALFTAFCLICHARESRSIDRDLTHTVSHWVSAASPAPGYYQRCCIARWRQTASSGFWFCAEEPIHIFGLGGRDQAQVANVPECCGSGASRHRKAQAHQHHHEWQCGH